MLFKRKDGGPKSHVWGFFFVELKKLFSIVLLKFEHGTREAYHSHAFNSVSWLLRGHLVESRIDRPYGRVYGPSFKPIITTRDNFHQVSSIGTSWVLSFRGPWADKWKEITEDGSEITLTHGRKQCS